MHDTLPLLNKIGFPPITRQSLKTIQVNLGYRCNQQCLHCHVNASPKRTEEMTTETVEQVLALLRRTGAGTLDLTGGAPELNANFRFLVESARELGVHVIDRCNLTILQEPGQEDLARFLCVNKVEVISSMPCYLKENVESQRGKGVFERSIEGLRELNRHGYGIEGTGLNLNLVYNPQGPSLPPPQCALETDYKRVLREQYGIEFNALLTLTNMPIKRFGSTLVSHAEFDRYMALLHGAHRDENLDGVMCRDLISVDWQGFVFDCDFNQMLDLPLRVNGTGRTHITELDSTLDGNPIVVRDHCYGCTAGQGSSCGGALTGGE